MKKVWYINLCNTVQSLRRMKVKGVGISDRDGTVECDAKCNNPSAERFAHNCMFGLAHTHTEVN